jgi:endoglucanase
VHVGEWGCYNRTPHDVALAWMKDYLELWKEAGWGWALWNFRGDFGPLDSKRQDVQYEDWKGHKLDRKMLELIQAY